MTNPNPTTRWPAWVAAGLLMSVGVVVGVGSVLAAANEAPTEQDKPRNAWTPPEVDRSAYRDIVDYNIFRADRKRIAQEVDRERNPPPPRDDTPREVVRTEDTPPDPDADWRLAGITHTPEGVVAYIENTKSGDLSKLTEPAAFSQGEITAIGYDAVMYVVAGEQRVISVGQTLVGTRVAPPGGSSRSTGNSKRDADLTPAERLRMLREQRAREQGTAAPDAPTREAPATRERAGDNQADDDPEPDDDAQTDGDPDAAETARLIADDQDLSTAGPDADDNNP
ncbi:MAG: hypothetical protein ACE37H_12185 [Phycisphaeraceae bacterium]